MYFRQILWTLLNTDKEQGHPLDNQSRNLLTCHKHMLYYWVELEEVLCWQMFNNWLSRKPEILICRVCHLCSVNILTMANFKLLTWLSLNSELGRDVNNQLSWADVIQPQHITGWKSPLISKGLKGSIWRRGSGEYTFGFRFCILPGSPDIFHLIHNQCKTREM